MLAAATGYAGGRVLFRPAERVIQPISFNHQIHTAEVGLECDTCHSYYADRDSSGLPTLETCLECHEDPQTENPEEARIAQLYEAGENDVFRKLFRLADHSYYSHRRHTTIAGLACETCHGDIASTSAPPETPLRRVTMDFCVDCHREQGLSSDCTRCHR